MNSAISPCPKLNASDPTLEPAYCLLVQVLPKPPSRSTYYRWVHGKQGIRLPCLKIANLWYTTPDAIDWFCDQRTQTSLHTTRQLEESDADELAMLLGTSRSSA